MLKLNSNNDSNINNNNDNNNDNSNNNNNNYCNNTQQWPVIKLKRLDREARKIVVENGGKHPTGSSAILYTSREKRGRGLQSIEEEYKETKIKAAVKLYRNSDPAIATVREFEERAEKLGNSSLLKEAARYTEEMGLQSQLEYPNPTCIKHDSEEVITAQKAELRRRKKAY